MHADRLVPVALVGVIALAGLLMVVPGARAGDRILMEAHTLDRDGIRLQRVIPSAQVIPSRDLVFACEHKVLSSFDVIVYDIETGACSTVPVGERPVNLVLDKPVMSGEGIGDFASVEACLDAHLAAFFDDTSGLVTCFRWYFCDELAPQIVGPAEVCEGTQIILDAGPGFATYLWGPGGETTPDIAVTPWVSTEYVVNVSDQWTCTGSDSLLVTALLTPEPAISGPTEMCSGETVTLDAGAGWMGHDWSTGATTRTIDVSPVASTIYTVMVGDGDGCSGTSPGHPLTVDEVWDVEFVDETVDFDMTVRSCSIVKAGPETHVVNAAHLTLQAGNTVVLRNGFSVEAGAELTIRLIAALNEP